MTLEILIKEQLDPHLVEVDEGMYYPGTSIRQLFIDGYFGGATLRRNVEVIGAVSQFCLTTGFYLWYQLAFSAYLENATQPRLDNDLQQQLLSGEILGATGLSNPMESFNDLEKLGSKHTYVDEQSVVSGRMSAVSNIQEDHYFGAISKYEPSDEFVMLTLRANQDGVTFIEEADFLGVSGSATYQITLNQVAVPQSQVTTYDVKQLTATTCPQFVTHQIPIGLDSIKSSLELIDTFPNTQNGINRYLEYDVGGFKKRYR